MSQKRDMGHPGLRWFGRLWRRLDLGGAAVYEELDAVDEAGVAGGEEEGDGCDLFGTAHLAARDQGRRSRRAKPPARDILPAGNGSPRLT